MEVTPGQPAPAHDERDGRGGVIALSPLPITIGKIEGDDHFGDRSLRADPKAPTSARHAAIVAGVAVRPLALIERDILSTQAPNHHLYQGRVHHRPYPVQPVEVLTLDESLLEADGIHRPDVTPLAHFATEVDVKVYAINQVA